MFIASWVAGKALLPQVSLVFGDLIAPPVTKLMDTYSGENFEQIALHKDVAEIYQYKNDFEVAALMYRLDLDLPERKKPSELRKRLIQIGNTARKLLRLLSPGERSRVAGKTPCLEDRGVHNLTHDRSCL